MNRRTTGRRRPRTLLETSDTPVSRRLLLIAGLLLVTAGLLLPLFDSDEARDPSLTSAMERAASLHESLGGRAAMRSGEATAFDRLIENLDLSQAPLPHPVRFDGPGYDVVAGVTLEFLTWFLNSVGYTAEQVEAGERTIVPPVVALHIPVGWADDLSVPLKKSVFYRVTLPLVLMENEAVLSERALLEGYRKKRLNRDPIAPGEHEAARAMAVRYGVSEVGSEAALDRQMLDELLRRVDTVPPSLALGQAAYESGYGTSRFATTGNALFGQWAWSEQAMQPGEQRDGMGDYGVQAFDAPIESVRAYLLNLNTHRAYTSFRQLRAQQRGGAEGRIRHDGLALAATLVAYSERREAYVDELQGIMRFNDLARADDLRLIPGEPVYFE